MTLIRTLGTAERHLGAERATLSVHLDVEHDDLDASREALLREHAVVVAEARSLRESGSATWFEAGAPATWSWRKIHPQTGKPLGTRHRTSAVVRVKLADLDLVGALEQQWALRGHTVGVEWTLTEVTRRRVERAVRLDAVAAARDIADDYAAALGATVVRVVRLDDEDERGAPMPTMRAGATAFSGAQGAEVSVRELTVRASIRGEYDTGSTASND